MFILFAVRAQLDSILLRNHERDLEDVDRIETETFAVERRIGGDLSSSHIEVQSLDDEIRDFSLQGSAACRRRRLSNWRRVVGHTNNNYVRILTIIQGLTDQQPWYPEQESTKQPGVHRAQQHVVPPVVEVRHPVFRMGENADR